MRVIGKRSVVHAMLLSFMAMWAVAPAMAEKIAGVDIAPSYALNNAQLVLNGAGIRKKLFLKLYVGSLYLPERMDNADKVVRADGLASMQLTITSGMISSDAMKDAITDGFEKSLKGNTQALATEIETLMKVFSSEIKEGDQIVFNYTPNVGTVVSKNGTEQATIKGLAFKQALWGIWLGQEPADEKLKKALLGL
ncbi:chalcone isomerase family protein [Marinibactrum halimedae]|uniref:Chalcone isomerase n=1 Tax=Marinibactrum halimedae TaxID=1444977 RepID=A0AA37WM60_9GAMM|nr:chalcone isomerase family protein [Marinibactrum halimedae]MCD9458679.1 chalcone isomerase family protein [Marinibactrum halimedae]GLS25955.1 chalcone isomerase [Marinibactrum halimedae]